ncbi:hypothetical protein MRX96_012924 [Rhipicephalus microplus]
MVKDTVVDGHSVTSAAQIRSVTLRTLHCGRRTASQPARRTSQNKRMEREKQRSSGGREGGKGGDRFVTSQYERCMDNGSVDRCSFHSVQIEPVAVVSKIEAYNGVGQP